ncbi:hypothetical protein G9P44_001729 [Scheffersomyces stipitis]|nr:hypothetical protein G9P44_001729 [Scheffersomyces stipitis]
MFGAANNSQAPTSGFGFGGANSAGSGFGAKPSGGLFGANQTTNTGPGTFGSGNAFGNNANNQQTAGSGGLFGASGQNQQQPTQNQNQQGGGLFGSNSNTAGTSSGGLFGSKPAAGGLFGGSTGAASTGLFGGQNQTQNPQNQQNQQNTGLFGSKPAVGGGLFGASTSGQTPAAIGGLFGGNTANTASSTMGGGLFGGSAVGNTQQNKPLFGGLGASGSSGTTGGLFGGSTANPGGLFSQQNQNQQNQFQQQQQNQQQNQQQLTAMTRVGDLPPAIRQELEEFDRYINKQHLVATTLQADYGKHDQLINTIPKDINYLHNKLMSTKQALKFDSGQLVHLKELNNEITDDISKIMQLILQLSTPGTRLSSSFQLNEFFVKKIKKYYEILRQYEGVVAELDSILGGLERSCTEGFGNLFNIVEVIKSQYHLFMELCETMAQLHNEVNKLSK